MICKEKLDHARIDNLYIGDMEMKDWIRSARAAAGLTQDQLGERLGVTKGNISAWENGRHQPSFTQLRAMAELSGKSLPGGTDAPAPDRDVLTSPARRSTDLLPGYVRLTLLDATPYMGSDGVPVDFPEVIKHVDVLRDYLVVELGTNPEHLCMLPVRGDSMSGTIEHNDLVFVDNKVREFDGDGVYVVVWNGGLVVKRLQGLPRGGLRLKSDNPKYDAVDIEADDARAIAICGRVVGSWKVRRI